MNYVTFYCRLTTSAFLEEDEQKVVIQDFVSDTKHIVQAILDAFVIDGGDLYPSLVTSEPPYQATYSLDEVWQEWGLDMRFVFQHHTLEMTLLRVELLKSLFQNLGFGKGVYPAFEYHLEDSL
ncbi:hypothetical protein CAPN005_03700 [Capnocytophaga cynodegmi]|nr:hypothetical protein CAPN005_03700 [Capnocytophaga cynodegmi]